MPPKKGSKVVEPPFPNFLTWRLDECVDEPACSEQVHEGMPLRVCSRHPNSCSQILLHTNQRELGSRICLHIADSILCVHIRLCCRRSDSIFVRHLRVASVHASVTLPTAEAPKKRPKTSSKGASEPAPFETAEYFDMNAVLQVRLHNEPLDQNNLEAFCYAVKHATDLEVIS